MSTARPDPESILLMRFHDFLLWLLPRLEAFPRSQRFLLAQKLLDQSYACYARLIRTRKVKDAARMEALLDADVILEEIRLSLRLSQETKCLTLAQYEHGARVVDEVGRMLGRRRFPVAERPA